MKLWKLAVGIVLVALAIALWVTLSRSEPATVQVSWTAPGDDGNVGLATEYDIRYHPDSATLVAWVDAYQVTDEPVPTPAGTHQVYVFRGLPSDSSYFCALRTRDEVYNWSGLSNVVYFTVPDREQPADVVDLQEDE